jgi:hypothetical protein
MENNNQVTNNIKVNVENIKGFVSDNFLFISDFLDEIYEVFTSTYYFGEFLLNLFFILLIIIISIILYWDNINTKVSKNSRCKKQLEIIDKSKGVYSVDAKDKNNNLLFQINYVLGAKRNSVECKCKEGDVVNTFRQIPIRDLQSVSENEESKNKVIDKKCLCDRYYDTGITSTDIIYEGDPGLIRYNDTRDSTFFDNYYNAQY